MPFLISLYLALVQEHVHLVKQGDGLDILQSDPAADWDFPVRGPVFSPSQKGGPGQSQSGLVFSRTGKSQSGTGLGFLSPRTGFFGAPGNGS